MEKIIGHLESIIFLHPENGFIVARLKEVNKNDFTTIVGSLPSVQPGETIEAEGKWIFHHKYGKQFQIESYQISYPADILGIQKYLESGLIKGIGPFFAKKIIEAFKEETLNVIDENPRRLLEIPGIGKKRITTIEKCWDKHKAIRQVMIFLRSNGVSPGFAQKIYRVYGDNSIEKVKENPYQLAKDIFRIGFKMADKIAINLGFAKESFQRIQAGIEFVLWELTTEGHTCCPTSKLIQNASLILEVDVQFLSEQLNILVKHNILNQSQHEDPIIWLKLFYYYEKNIALEINRLLHEECHLRKVDIEKAIIWIEQKLSMSFAEKQKVALKCALDEKIHIITGGPGTGKSTITRAILEITLKLTNKIILAAPTGRAAKRLTQITQKKAFTIHSILEFDPSNGKFKRDKDNPLECDLLIIDEASMIDTQLMYLLLNAIPSSSRVLFIGDIDQLPSVGAGNVLKDVIASKKVGVTRLAQIFRQSHGSQITVNAHKINHGEFPFLSQHDWSDFHYYEENEPELIQQRIISLVADIIPKQKPFDNIFDIQVLSPMKKGIIGTEMLNFVLQSKLNPSNHPFYQNGKRFHVRDKVMQIKNNYNKKVYNGDIGLVQDISHEDQKLTILFERKLVAYDFSELDEIVLAYAVSVHKYQGSECPCIVIPIHTSHFKLLHRNLIYTAITRGKKFVVLVGSKKAIAIAIQNNEVKMRYTGLQEAVENYVTMLPGSRC